MFKRILVPTDGSARAEHAARAAIELAKFMDAEVVSLYVYPPFQLVITEHLAVAPGLINESDYARAQRAAARRILGVIDKAARAAGVVCTSLCIEDKSPAATIVATARSTDAPCDLVFIGSHGRGVFAQTFLGSVTTRVQAMCDVPVLVYRDPQAKKTGKKPAKKTSAKVKKAPGKKSVKKSKNKKSG